MNTLQCKPGAIATWHGDNFPIVKTDCTIEFNGREYEAGGAVVTDTQCAFYLASQAGGTWHGGNLPIRLACGATDWHGNSIGTAWITGKWRTRSGDWMYSCRVEIAGSVYTARGSGAGMLFTGKRAKVQILVV